MKQEELNLSKSERKSRFMGRLMPVLVCLQTVMTAVAVRFLPDTIPMHFGSQGNVNRYGSKYELYALVVFSVVIVLVEKGSLASVRDKINAAENEKQKNSARTMLYALSIVGVVLVIIMFAAEISLIATGSRAGSKADEKQFIELFMMIINSFIGIILVLFGNVIPKTGINGMFGVRTGWSSYNDETWARSNRAGGKICMVTGVLCILAALLIEFRIGIFIILGLVVIMAVVCVVVSYRVYKDVKAKEEDTAQTLLHRDFTR